METPPQSDPAFDGECAFALSTGKQGVAGRQDLAFEQDGRRYLFSNRVARFLWKVLPGRRAKAEATWAGD
ncbi:MAG: hypothetical protein R3314_00620 [Longimicrobiales bacterium]|nr:hypothetical protein [Longimicrobiales bacterium]